MPFCSVTVFSSLNLPRHITIVVSYGGYRQNVDDEIATQVRGLPYETTTGT
jgi:hypothetical protein